ncbi:MAG: 4-hydroxy-tetrahydrodipicolinate synthase [Actinomycetota bacterium]|jgi:4-hydroxy-tetrahydrodipicolinate synthase|nr:4-hydroxy-tetrahydrodipicolinate synthase [Actinomycetota bacterium]
MVNDLDLRGVWVPLITPFDARGAVDVGAIERLCHEFSSAGVSGIVALGTTGEATALDADEKQAVIAVVVRACTAARTRVIVGTGSNNTEATIRATAALAETSGVVGALVVVPYYVRPAISGIVAHFRAVAAASPVPVIVYNIPARTGRDLGAAGLLELAQVPNIAGVKQAVATLDADTLEVLANAPDGFGVLGGEDTLLFPLMCMGALGTISAAAHLCTERFVAMIECGLAGKIEDGRAHAEALLPVIRAAYADPNPAVFKGVLHAQGRIATPDVRLPLTNGSAGAVRNCLDAVERASHP